ncbi:hypothetical protein [Paraglaciecola sp. 2405UD69-4]|uniref:hypothetical protein n=1 Tax=Paraglaciecola sp. 2405UD69-4 TaxID=3391836 RepID=UPI0039C9DBBB
MSDNVLSKLSLFMAALFTSGLLYLIYSKQINALNMLFSIGAIVMSLSWCYKLSKKYKAKNSVNELIKRDGNLLECKSAGTVFTSNIDIQKIEKVTICHQYISIIEENNGKGYDVFLISDAQEIMVHMLNLFTKEELKTIDLIKA